MLCSVRYDALNEFNEFYVHDMCGLHSRDFYSREIHCRIVDEDGIYLLLNLISTCKANIVTSVELAQHNLYTERGLSNLAEGLMHAPHACVNTLVLHCATDSLAKLFRDNACTIEQITVCGDNATQSFWTALLSNPRLRVLKIIEAMDERRFLCLCDLLAGCTLQEFTMTLYEETHKYYPYFLQQITACTTLTLFKLDGSLLGNSNAIELAKLLPGTRITTLSLACCFMGDPGMQNLVQCLHLTRVEELDLSFNDCGPLAVAALAEALCFNSRLRVLKMRECRLNPQTGITLANALRQSTLQELDISYNALGDEWLPVLVTALRSKDCHLQQLNTQCCAFTRECLTAQLRGALLNPYCNLRVLELGLHLPEVTGMLHLARNIHVLLSSRQIKHLGRMSAVRNLPCELIRLVCMMLG